MKKIPQHEEKLEVCEFHEGFSHSIAGYFQLWEEIEAIDYQWAFEGVVVGMRHARKSKEKARGKEP